MKKRICLAAVVLSLAALLLTSCAQGGNKTVMTVGGNKVTYDEYRYFYMNFRREHEAMGETDYEDELKKEIEAAVRQKYAKVNMARENGVILTEEELDGLDTIRASYVQSFGGEEGFQQAMADSALTDKLFMKQIEFQQLESKFRAYACEEFSGMIRSDDATVEAYIQSDFYHATHVLILSEEGDDLVANYNLAKEVHDRALAGEDFEKLVLEFNEDPGMVQDATGYYFTVGQLLKPFEDAVLAMEIGEISDVVMTVSGYHVIQRLPLDDEYIDQHFEELREAYKARKFNLMVEEEAASLEVKYSDFYESLTDEMLVANTVEK